MGAAEHRGQGVSALGEHGERLETVPRQRCCLHLAAVFRGQQSLQMLDQAGGCGMVEHHGARKRQRRQRLQPFPEVEGDERVEAELDEGAIQLEQIRIVVPECRRDLLLQRFRGRQPAGDVFELGEPVGG